jgi:hypothetical protein
VFLYNTGVRCGHTVHKTIFIVTAVRNFHLKNLSRIPLTIAFGGQSEAIGPGVLCQNSNLQFATFIVSDKFYYHTF